MPKQRQTVDDLPRWVMVQLPREMLKALERRRDAFNEPKHYEAPPGHPRVSGLRISSDTAATILLLWALEHAPEPLP